MKLSLTGKIIWIGHNSPDEGPRASILLSEGDDEKEPMSLEVDLGQQEAKEIARHLYEDVRICIEVPPRPTIVE